MDELLDLVNESDDVIGEVWKSKANSDPKLIHREIEIFLFDKFGNILLQKRSLAKKVYPGYWTESCAGHVLKGENPEVTAHRELKEELGFDTKLIFITKKLIKFSKETHLSYKYIGEYSGEKLVIQKNEIEEVKFFTKKEFEKFFENENIHKITREWIEKIWGMK